MWQFTKVALAMVVAGSLVLVSGHTVAASAATRKKPGASIPFKDARIKFEINATDGDGGMQIFVDADEWKSLEIRDPNGKMVFESRTRGAFGKNGGTELFLETGEPAFTELPLPELLERFPAGVYTFRAKGLEGERMTGTATLTHNLPDGPHLMAPLQQGPLQQGPLQDPNNTTLVWEPVPPPNGSPIVAYQVLVVNPSTGLPAVPKVTLDVHMPPTATRLIVPQGFLRPDTEYEWEVLAIEAGGNQTLSSSFFKTMP